MRKKPFVITLPAPCSENWEMMSNSDRGRFCGQCQKTVIDFSTMTDAEIIRYFKESKDNKTCGRFHGSQLNRELVQSQPVSFSAVLLKRTAAALLFFQTVVTTAWSQTVRQKTEQQPAQPNILLQKPIIIQGKVIDHETGKPMPGMMVRVVTNDNVDFTDSQGCFKIPCPENMTRSDVPIRVSNSVHLINHEEPQGVQILEKRVNYDTIVSGGDILISWYPQQIVCQAQKVTLGLQPPIFMGASVAPVGDLIYKSIWVTPTAKKKKKKAHHK